MNKAMTLLAVVCLLIPLQEVQADITKDLIGKWSVTETWRQGKERGTIKGTATIRRFQKTGFVVRASARVKGAGLVRSTDWYYADGTSEGVATAGGRTIAMSSGTWRIERRSIIGRDTVSREDGTFNSNGRITVVNRNNLSGLYTTSWRVRGTTTFKRIGN